MIALWKLVFVLQAALVTTQLTASNFPPLIDATIDDIKAGLESGLFNSVALVRTYLDRIAEVNPVLRAVTEANPDAVDIATALDAERAEGKLRGPLHGIPILIKNNIATLDKMNTTAGSFVLLGALPPRDSFVASRLRAAGAIILGKANLSQWANFRSSNSSNGWSAHGGQVKAAYIQDQDPSGSSSGSGVAAALGLAAVCLGTETDGSILSPAHRNNVVGIKPTVGLTSRDLVIPISEHQDTVGPIARTVKDAAYVLQAIAGMDENDSYTSAIPMDGVGVLPDYVAACNNEEALRGARLGIPSNVIELFLQFDNSSQPEVDAFLAVMGIIESAGAVVLQNTNFTNLTEWANSTAEGTVLRADFITNLAAYLGQLTTNPNNVTSLADVARFTKTASPDLEEFPDRNTETWDMALDPETGFNNTDPRIVPVLEENRFLGGEGGLLGALDRHGLDAIILPSGFAPGFAAIIGAPAVTVPLGSYPADAPVIMNFRGDLVDTGPNVPFGLAFLGRHFDEAKLIGLAHAFEQKTKVRGTIQTIMVPSAEVVVA
ncbi:glutamyl-tRNA amidotransferase subunit A [Apodospora peruviana]|uniref:Glutamyl-tRNA amidotransferase subunit A n=1 Tax=Apodospora peruviana TaxID=516989 RepID=A0AAE0LYW1_9PEZI|nr:glutamyl-tRNA amidotransferase subunit A [Apodospora peruviana]